MEAVNAANLVLLLQNASVVPVFRLYCCGLRLEDYLDVYLTLTKFSSVHTSGSKADKPLSKHAAEIMEKYFSEDSFYKLELVNSSVIESTNESIANNVSPTVFQPIQQACFDILEERALSSFISSQCYVTFISTTAATF